jgi:hypothetical protein
MFLLKLQKGQIQSYTLITISLQHLYFEQALIEYKQKYKLAYRRFILRYIDLHFTYTY